MICLIYCAVLTLAALPPTCWLQQRTCLGRRGGGDEGMEISERKKEGGGGVCVCATCHESDAAQESADEHPGGDAREGLWWVRGGGVGGCYCMYLFLLQHVLATCSLQGGGGGIRPQS